MSNPYAAKYKGLTGSFRSQVPDGNVEDVMKWVGGNYDRAEIALLDEQEKDKPRRTLIDRLEKLLSEEED